MKASSMKFGSRIVVCAHVGIMKLFFFLEFNLDLEPITYLQSLAFLQ